MNTPIPFLSRPSANPLACVFSTLLEKALCMMLLTYNVSLSVRLVSVYFFILNHNCSLSF